MKSLKFLTKNILQQDYDYFKSIKLISEKYDVYPSTIRYYLEKFDITTISKTRYHCKHDIFSQNNELAFYLAGFIAADGCLRQGKKSKYPQLNITLSTKDEKHLLKIKELLEFEGPIKYTTNKMSKYNITWKDGHQCKIDIYSRQISTNLQNIFDIGQRKSLIYSMPTNLINNNLIKHFIRGYSDGDGSFFITKVYKQTIKFGLREYIKYNFTLRGTEKMLWQIKTIFEQNGIITISTPKFNNGIYQLKYSGNGQVKKIANYLYQNSNYFMDRKFNIIKHFLDES